MISVIIPVYNTEKFLKKCLDSVIGQTYRDLEIILVNDGSTDNSLAICREYEKKDSRIVLFSKENEGQGKARNLGILESHGDYITFVDSDDWIHSEMVERLYQSMTEQESNIAICDFYKTKLDSEEISQIIEEKIDISDFLLLHENKTLLERLSFYSCGKLYRRKLFLQYDIFFPGHFYEDVALLPVLYARADRISFVREPLYYYRDQRGNTTNRIAAMDGRIECLETLLRMFERQELLEEYREALVLLFEKRIQINKRMVGSALQLKYEDFASKQQEWFDREFLQINERRQYPKVCIVGSYNLMTVAKVIMGYENEKNVEDYFGWESLISCMSPGEELNKCSICHKNPMRRKCLIQDFSKRFCHLNGGEFRDTDYIFVDFLEERFPVGCYEGEYFTVSDAWLDIQDSVPISYTEIEPFSEEWFVLWKEAAGRFMERLLRFVTPEKIVLVRMVLAEQYEEDDSIRDFPEKETLSKINQKLEECYDYFSGLNENIQDISVKQLPYYKTSSTFRHGCYPYHLGNEAYQLLAEEIGGQLEKCGK